ncbi:hypothetical protein, partial [Paenibacillus alginolyticus]
QAANPLTPLHSAAEKSCTGVSLHFRCLRSSETAFSAFSGYKSAYSPVFSTERSFSGVSLHFRCLRSSETAFSAFSGCKSAYSPALSS